MHLLSIIAIRLTCWWKLCGIYYVPKICEWYEGVAVGGRGVDTNYVQHPSVELAWNLSRCEKSMKNKKGKEIVQRMQLTRSLCLLI